MKQPAVRLHAMQKAENSGLMTSMQHVHVTMFRVETSSEPDQQAEGLSTCMDSEVLELYQQARNLGIQSCSGIIMSTYLHP